MDERRSEQRLMCSQVVTLRLGKRGSAGESRTAILEDISGAGACVQTTGPVPVGVAAVLIASRRRFHGTIRYCEFRDIGYFVGIEFDPGVKWSDKDFVPKHLLDPRAVKGGRRNTD